MPEGVGNCALEAPFLFIYLFRNIKFYSTTLFLTINTKNGWSDNLSTIV